MLLMESHTTSQCEENQQFEGNLRNLLICYLVLTACKVLVLGLLIFIVVELAGFGAQRFGHPNYIFLMVVSALLAVFNAIVFYHIYRAYKGNVKSVKFLIAVMGIDAVIILVTSVLMSVSLGSIPLIIGFLVVVGCGALAASLNKEISQNKR